MVVKIEDVKNVYRNIISGLITLEEADRWAWKLITENDKNNLFYDDLNDEKIIWKMVIYLYGIDIPDLQTNIPQRTKEDILFFLKSNNIII
ncbi:hypothetical protein MTP09_09890 [Chryseobacterium suipulveris]|uniref:Uncharacterized protein n=1 Tax=Chryseobacterium suipulveris TaxID=2929800 RepID=A0ABY4BQ11_9FLAO|nr:hypothetical protein [Chryseobacterium suipulveris]UOE39886.1 hypothetical protein MTP09_08090 [Chryseobacterium suipulveris]UOE40224.1 hypothetical protein MTP09_09890 [Chryseobacterium suipulveris]